MVKTLGAVHFSIPVTDIEKSRRFYTEILGMTVIADIDPMEMVFLDCGGDCIVLVKVDKAISTARERRMHHAFRVALETYGQSVAELKAKGINVLYEEDRQDGVIEGARAYFHDPDGNTLEIIALTDYARGFRTTGKPVHVANPKQEVTHNA